MNTATQLLERYKYEIEFASGVFPRTEHGILLKDTEAYLAKQQDSTFEVYEVWMGRIKFATFATREQADAVVNSTAPSVGAHVSVTTVLGGQAKQQVEQEPVRGVVIREGYPTLVKDTPLAYYPCDTRLYTSPTAKERSAAIKTLTHLGYTYHGGEQWKPPLGAPPPAREPLSDEAIDTITTKQWGDSARGLYAAYRTYAHAIEAKLGVTK